MSSSSEADRGDAFVETFPRPGAAKASAAQAVAATPTSRPTPSVQGASVFVPASLPSPDEVAASALTQHGFHTGRWSRLGGPSIDGDAVIEDVFTKVADDVRAAARAEGYADGWAAAKKAADIEAAVAEQRRVELFEQREIQRATEHRAAIENLMSAARTLRDSVDDAARRVEQNATEVAASLVETLVAHELACASALPVVEQALALAPDDSMLTIKLAPADLSDVSAQDLSAKLRVQGAPELSHGEVVIEFDDSVIDARVHTAAARVAAVLRGADVDDLH